MNRLTAIFMYNIDLKDGYKCASWYNSSMQFQFCLTPANSTNSEFGMGIVLLGVYICIQIWILTTR